MGWWAEQNAVLEWGHEREMETEKMRDTEDEREDDAKRDLLEDAHISY